MRQESDDIGLIHRFRAGKELTLVELVVKYQEQKPQKKFLDLIKNVMVEEDR